MRIRKILTILKDSLFNVVRHPLVTLASMTTVTLMLILLGAFTVLSQNANYWVKTLAQQPAIEVWGDPKMSEDEQLMVKQFLDSNDNVLEYELLTPVENFEVLRSQMGSDAAALDNFDYSLLPYVFQVQLVNPELADDFTNQVSAYPGVTDVDYEEKVMSTLANVVRWVNVVTLITFAVMVVVSLFIISNMVQLSILAQSEEIGIMKYIGATNNYIRIPYILEGAMIGTLGALLAWGIVYFTYDQVYNRLSSGELGSSTGALFASSGFLLATSEVMLVVLLINLLLGIVIGATGSMMSVRKYIQV